MLTSAEIKKGRESWTQKDRYSGESKLIVLPCNDGGPIGNYFLGGRGQCLWRAVDWYLQDWRDDCILMAVDNAVSWMPGRNDGLGSAEFEFEMTRCISSDDYGAPNLGRFDAWKMKLFVENLRITCRRIKAYGFKQVFGIITPTPYRTAFMEAARLEDLPVMLFQASMCGVGKACAQLLRAVLLFDSEIFYPESVLFTHSSLAKGSFPAPPAAWEITDPVARLKVRDLSGLIVKVIGRCKAYYCLRSDMLLEKEEYFNRYLISTSEDRVLY